jgi:threonine aldolase
MSEEVYDFRSDNVGGVAPELLEAMVAANCGAAAPYGDDDFTRAMTARFRNAFEHDGVTAFPLATGTGANCVALAGLANPYGAIYCHETAHINVYECGAPELFTGAKLVGLPGAGYKLHAAALDTALSLAGRGNATRVQPFALNLTQPTDFGTLYSLAELRDLSELAHRHGLLVHLDGARFANAIAALGCTPAAMTWRAGIDVVSFGATKNGAMNAEAVLVFDPTVAARIPFLMKRGGQVVSKARFLSAQLDRYLADDRWLDRARQANANAARLAGRLQAIRGVEVLGAVEINMLFARLPDTAIAALDAGPFRYYKLGHEQRFVCRHDQEPVGMDLLVSTVRASPRMKRASRRDSVVLAACAGLLGALLIETPVVHSQSLDVISLHHRMAEDLLPILQPLVPAGAIVTGTGDMLFVRADAATLRQVREAVASLDRAPRQLLITVGQGTNAQGSGTSVRGSGTLGSGNVQVGVNRPPAAESGGQVVVHGGTASDDLRNVSSVRALEGRETYVALGQSQPFTTTTVTGGGRHPSIVSNSTEFRDVQTGFYATPRIAGDRVTLELSSSQQRVSGDARPGLVTTGAVTSTVSGKLGEWIQVGGTVDATAGSANALFTWGTRSDLTQYTAWVKVDEVP